MSLTDWLSLAAICCLGAISPGPSLAMVVRHTLLGSRAHGVIASFSHGAGIGAYAVLSVTGLAVLITRSDTVFAVLRYAGAIFLAYLGLRALIVSSEAARFLKNGDSRRVMSRWISARDGFLIAFLNPKIAVFFIALFSQFVRPQAAAGEKLGMVSLAAGIDVAWYLLVSLALSHTRVMERMRAKAAALDKAFGVILLLLALRVVFLES